MNFNYIILILNLYILIDGMFLKKKKNVFKKNIKKKKKKDL